MALGNAPLLENSPSIAPINLDLRTLKSRSSPLGRGQLDAVGELLDPFTS